MSSERGCTEQRTRGRKVLNSAKCSPVSSRTLFAGDGNVSTPFSSILDECVVVALCTVIVTQNILKQYSQQREVISHCTYSTRSGNGLQGDSKAECPWLCSQQVLSTDMAASCYSAESPSCWTSASAFVTETSKYLAVCIPASPVDLEDRCGGTLLESQHWREKLFKSSLCYKVRLCF